MFASHAYKFLLLSLLLGIASGPAIAEEAPANRDLSKEIPAGIIEIESTSIRLLLGGNWGSGTLHFQGKHYPFKVKGLSAGGIGIDKVDAIGRVYFLNMLEDFEGQYSYRTAGATAIDGSSTSTYDNNKGVVFTLHGKTTGLGLSLGLGGISISLEK